MKRTVMGDLSRWHDNIKFILRKWCVEVWTRLNWLSMELDGGLF
jgi:hypothetical protein